MTGRPLPLRVGGRRPPAAAEPHFVDALEVAAIAAEEMLWPVRLMLVVAVVRHAAIVDVVVPEGDGRQQHEPGIDVGAADRREQAAHREVALALEVPRRSALLPGRFARPRRT